MDISSINWTALEDAYGPATDVPELLRQISFDKSPQNDTRSGPWFELWSRLYHQDSIYPASYAAVPFIIEFIKEANGLIDINFFLLPVCIEVSRNRESSPEIPEFLKENYISAIKNMGKLADNYIHNENGTYIGRVAKAAKLVSEEKHEEARTLIDI